MKISESPVAKPSQGTNEIKDRVPVVIERAPEAARETKVSVSRSTSLGMVFYKSLVWGLVTVGVAVGWYYHAKWLPLVAPYVGLNSKPPSKPPARVIPVVTAVVVQKDMEVFINGLGTVTAFKTVTMRSRVEGELVKVAFTEGQMVHEGDLLAEIDRRQFDVQLQQAEGQLERDEATLKAAELTYKRYQELIGSKSITPQQIDEQRSLVQQTTGAIQSDKANVNNAKLQLDYCHIIAPISGRIGLRLVDQGNIIRANDPLGLAVITQLQPIALVFTIPQDDISRVQKAFLNNNDLAVTAWDRDFKMKLATGKLLAIDNQVDATTGTVRLKAVFENEDGMLFPQQFVNARLLVDTKKDAIVVPNAAVQRGPSSVFVYVVETKVSEDTGETIETVDLRNVTVGLTEGAETAVTTGLTPGEIVVTEGLDKLQKGAMISTSAKEKDKDKDKDKKSKPSDKSPPGDAKAAAKSEPKNPSEQKPESGKKSKP